MYIEWSIKRHSMIVTANNYRINIICIKVNDLQILYLPETLLWPLQTSSTTIASTTIASIWNVSLTLESLTSALEESLIIELVPKVIVFSKFGIDILRNHDEIAVPKKNVHVCSRTKVPSLVVEYLICSCRCVFTNGRKYTIWTISKIWLYRGT